MARWLTLHNVIAIYAALALIVVSATGVWILRPQWIDPAVGQLTPLRDAWANGQSAGEWLWQRMKSDTRPASAESR